MAEYLTEASDLYAAVAAQAAAKFIDAQESAKGNGHSSIASVEVYVGNGLPRLEVGANESVFGTQEIYRTPAEATQNHNSRSNASEAEALRTALMQQESSRHFLENK